MLFIADRFFEKGNDSNCTVEVVYILYILFNSFIVDTDFELSPGKDNVYVNYTKWILCSVNHRWVEYRPDSVLNLARTSDHVP